MQITGKKEPFPALFAFRTAIGSFIVYIFRRDDVRGMDMIPLGGIPSANLLSFSLVIFSLCYNLRFYGFILFLFLRFPAVVRFHVIRPAQDCSLTHCAQDVPYRWSANTSDFVTIAGRLSIGTSSPKLLLSLRIPQPRLADSGTRLTLTNYYCNIEKPLKDVFPLAVFNIFRLNQYRYVVAVSEVFHAASIRALSNSFPGTARSKKPLPS